MDVTLILVTLLSLALATVMTVLAWRLAREQRRRSDARVAELAAEIHGGRDRDLPLHHVAPVVTSHNLFDAAAGQAAPPSRRTAVIVGAVAIAGCAALVWSFSSHSKRWTGVSHCRRLAGTRHMRWLWWRGTDRHCAP